MVAQQTVRCTVQSHQPAQHRHRIGAAVDQIPQQIQRVAAWREIDPVQQTVQRLVAALHIAYQVNSHAAIDEYSHSARTKPGMDVLLIVFLNLRNGVFAMSEMALASSRKARLAALEESGDKGAAAALQLLEQPTQFLSTVQEIGRAHV